MFWEKFRTKEKPLRQSDWSSPPHEEFSRFQLGQMGQEAAERFLKRKGLLLLERNFRTRRGEIDLIMRDQATVVFVEVKTRSSHAFGTPLAAVDPEKQRRLSVLALHYLQRQRLSHIPARFDVVGVAFEQREEIQWIQNAFEAMALD
jgi:putative endonuclease